MKHFKTDVLCIGGGGAGITAAIAASKQGKQVILASKGAIGNSGNTIMIGGSYAMDGESAYYKYGIEDADPKYTKAMLYESIIKDGFYLSDQSLVQFFVDKSPEIVNHVRLWAEENNHPFHFYKPATWVMSGKSFGRALNHGLKKESNITKLEDVMITDLLQANGRVTGAVGIDIETGEGLHIDAKAVVLGTGGFQPFSLKNTNSDMTGDGIAMAYRAGAQVADMEFLLFLVTALEPNEIKGSIIPIMATVEPSFNFIPTDRNGQPITIPEKLRKIEESSELCKLIHHYYFGQTILEGRGTPNGGVYYDFSHMSDDEIRDMFDKVIEELAKFYRKGFYHGDDLRVYRDLAIKQKRLEIGLGNEYSVGGIVINEKMQTSIPGLYAAGECSTGLFGANRVADAVVEMIVEGYEAGQQAARYVDEVQHTDNSQQAKDMIKGLLQYFENQEGITAPELNHSIELIADKSLGLIRNETDLSNALIELKKLLDKPITLKSKSRIYNTEWIDAIQGRNRLLCTYLATIMAKERKESRGLHMRSDYPFIDNDHFLHRNIVKNDNGVPNLSTQKPIVTTVSLPSGLYSFEEFIIEFDLGLQNMYSGDEV
jgi:succinate dehydrogenase / fumarate reductase flavoprotein subunit